MRAFFVFCLSLTLPGGKTRRVRKPTVFIRFDVPPQGAFSCPFGSIHLVAVKAGINLRDCGPSTTLRFLGKVRAVI